MNTLKEQAEELNQALTDLTAEIRKLPGVEVASAEADRNLEKKTLYLKVNVKVHDANTIHTLMHCFRYGNQKWTMLIDRAPIQLKGRPYYKQPTMELMFRLMLLNLNYENAKVEVQYKTCLVKGADRA